MSPRLIALLAAALLLGPAAPRGQGASDAARLVVMGAPSVPTCPAANCPAPPHPPVLSTQVVYGETTKGPEQHEWLSSLGLFVRTGAPDGQKVTQYLGVVQAPGAGTAWALNTDTVRNGLPGGPNSFGGSVGSGTPGPPGAIGDRNGSIGYELDFTNWDARSAPGVGPFTVGQYVHAQGSFTSLAAFYLDATMAPGVPAWHNGLFFNGESVVEANTIFDGTNAHNSITVAGRHVNGLDTTSANDDLRALTVKAGQTVCFDGEVHCVTWRDGRFAYLNARGEAVFTVDEEGNATFRGRVVENAR